METDKVLALAHFASLCVSFPAIYTAMPPGRACVPLIPDLMTLAWTGRG